MGCDGGQEEISTACSRRKSVFVRCNQGPVRATSAREWAVHQNHTREKGIDSRAGMAIQSCDFYASALGRGRRHANVDHDCLVRVWHESSLEIATEVSLRIALEIESASGAF